MQRENGLVTKKTLWAVIFKRRRVSAARIIIIDDKEKLVFNVRFWHKQ